MTDKAIALLLRMIATPSLSRQEDNTASLIFDYLQASGANPKRLHNNIWAMSTNYSPDRPTLLLNSHHDTVKPSPSYTRDPFSPEISEGRLYGLGSNDAGASVVSLIHAFLALKDEQLPVNLLLAITAEEEVMGENGMRAFLPAMQEMGIKIDMAIVGEPTGMLPAIAERGLVVLDGLAKGKAGHAARNEGINALYIALEDIATLRNFKFQRQSSVLGPIGITITQIKAGTQHNVVPDSCEFVVDVRTTDAYTNEETVELLNSATRSELKPRSTRVRASVLDAHHPLTQAAIPLTGTPYVSPTTSDMALMQFPSLKLGPGQSSRSHTADEFVLVSEIEDAIPKYISIIQGIKI